MKPEKIKPALNKLYVEILDLKEEKIGGIPVKKNRDDGYTEAKVISVGYVDKDYLHDKPESGDKILIDHRPRTKFAIISFDHVLGTIVK